MAQGLSTKEIAQRLGISVKTVGSHRTDMMAKLHVRDQASLLRNAVTHKLIES
jgi:DNA-binding NarL/FixJ family response regulator